MMILSFGRLSSSLPRLGAVFTAFVIWAGASFSATATIPDQQNPSPSPGAPSVENPSGRKYPPRIYNTVRISGAPPAIDGRLDDSVWQEGEWAGDYKQQAPVEGAKPSAPTELKILYDDRNLYVAIRAYDDPALVHRYPGRRDDFAGYAVDIVGVCFDSYNGKRTGFEFDLTAGGGKIDLVLGNGENEWDTTWDAVWDGAVAHDNQGWTAEFRIPLNQLRYGPQDEQVWGLHAWRWISRNKEESQWQLIPRQNTGRMHQLGELHGIRGLTHPRHVELLPYALGKVEPNGAGTGGMEGAGTAGLDAKVGLTTNVTLDLTVNPDFGQVEADPSVINLTAYETFYPERRPFFLEGKKILSFGIDGFDQLFYSRRIGQAPSYTPALGQEETVDLPERTTILGAAKITGRTDGGLSVGVLQSFTSSETAQISSPSGSREQQVEPFGSYSVGRIHKDWNKGNTSLGGMVTETHRSISEPQLKFLPSNALTGGIDFMQYYSNRSWVLDAMAVFSQVHGDRQAIRALQTNAVHYYQRPDATHLGVDEAATSLSGHGGSVRFSRSESSRLRLADHFRWYSPGLDLNDLGYLRQADLMANQAFLGWAETEPKWIFRSYSMEFAREDHWDFGGLKTLAENRLEASAQFKNKWETRGSFGRQNSVDTRTLRGGPALRWHDFWSSTLGMGTDSSRRISFALDGAHDWAVDNPSHRWSVGGLVRVRPSNRFSFSGRTSYEVTADTLQYVATPTTTAGSRWVLGRVNQDIWNFTLRADYAITPNLTLQYYGSPFIGTGRYAEFKQATETLAQRYENRFHRYTANELAYSPASNTYGVREATGGAIYSFANPDFSFRQFRSNFVARWEYRPGSTLYFVWSQGRTSEEYRWDSSFSSNWNALWRQRPDNVIMVKLAYWLSP
jgi:hypothetical protein